MAASNPVVEVDVAALAVHPAGLRVLLVRRAREPFAGAWALPGVRLENGERLDAAAKRALVERTGLRVPYLEQLYTFDDPARDPRGRTLSVAYVALLPSDAVALRPGRAVEDVRWWPADAPPPLAFDHAEILRAGCVRVRAKVEYAPIVFSVLPDAFTLRDLREAHEVLSGRPYPRASNFARQMTQRWGLEPTGRKVQRAGRPAELFRYPGAVDRNAPAAQEEPR